MLFNARPRDDPALLCNLSSRQTTSTYEGASEYSPWLCSNPCLDDGRRYRLLADAFLIGGDKDRTPRSWLSLKAKWTSNANGVLIPHLSKAFCRERWSGLRPACRPNCLELKFRASRLFR